jgi:hypothetical protein
MALGAAARVVQVAPVLDAPGVDRHAERRHLEHDVACHLAFPQRLADHRGDDAQQGEGQQHEAGPLDPFAHFCSFRLGTAGHGKPHTLMNFALLSY